MVYSKSGAVEHSNKLPYFTLLKRKEVNFNIFTLYTTFITQLSEFEGPTMLPGKSQIEKKTNIGEIQCAVAKSKHNPNHKGDSAK